VFIASTAKNTTRTHKTQKNDSGSAEFYDTGPGNEMALFYSL